jgi:SAM-dependent methyltransferase
MMQNIYDHPTFFAGYKAFREDPANINRFLEQPALRALLPSLRGQAVLDLGCGMGDFCRAARAGGARRVVGVDLSARMLAEAMRDADGIEYRRAAAESCRFPAGAFDLVVSSYTFHYVRSFRPVARRIARWLAPGGRLVFSVEHPMQTCANLYWELDDEGKRFAFRVKSYKDEGPREARWFVEGVVKYHRTVETYVNDVIASGLQVEAIREPHVAAKFERARPELRVHRERPAVLLVAARKPGRAGQGTGTRAA